MLKKNLNELCFFLEKYNSSKVLAVITKFFTNYKHTLPTLI